MDWDQAAKTEFSLCLVLLCRTNPHRKGHTFPSCTLNVKAKDSKWCNPLPFSLWWVPYEISPSNVHFILTQGYLRNKCIVLFSNWWKFCGKKKNTSLMSLERSWPTFPGFWGSMFIESFSSRTLYFPLGSSIQQHPVTSVSTINLITEHDSWN